MNCAFLLDRLAALHPDAPALIGPGLARRWRETRRRVARLAGGQTEATQMVCLMSPAQHGEAAARPARLRSCGRPVQGMQMRVAGENGRPVPSGDLATVDAGGFVHLLDRKQDMIISGGENVCSPEVETALASHPAVLESAVIRVPDDTWGERVHAVVVLAPGSRVSAEELRRHCRASIGGYKVPRSVEFREALPRTGAGKIQETVLREPQWRGRERAVHRGRSPESRANRKCPADNGLPWSDPDDSGRQAGASQPAASMRLPGPSGPGDSG